MRFGVEVSFIDSSSVDGYKKAIKENTKVLMDCFIALFLLLLDGGTGHHSVEFQLLRIYPIMTKTRAAYKCVCIAENA